MSSVKLDTPREKILSVAGPLFYREGYRAVGVDRVIAEAGVAKATFYKHFPAKDDLIVAWIERAEATSVPSFPAADSPAPLFDYVDHLINIAKQHWCLGCTYQGTAAEFPDPSHPAHAAALGVKRRTLATLQERAKMQGAKHPKATAESIYLLLEGVWSSVRMFGPDAPLTHASKAARLLFQ
jgi:AcrR family transcriptional regulator